MAPPPPSSSLLRELLAADGFKNRRKPPTHSDSSAPAASRATSMPLQHRRPGNRKPPSRSQSDVLARSRLRDMNDDDSRDAAADRRRAATATRGSSASLASARSHSIKGDGSGAPGGARRGASASDPAAVPALDESALTALISLAAGPLKRFAKDEAFRASLRAACASCLGYDGESNSTHRAVLDLRVHAQTVERAASAREEDVPLPLDPRDLKRASVKLHEIASLSGKDADAVTATTNVPYARIAACAHVYMAAVSKLQKRDHSAAVHALEAFCLAPREARTLLLPGLWDRLFRAPLSHLRAWRDRESAAASADERVKDVEKVFVEVLDDGTRKLACYYRDWLLGRTDAMALPEVPAPPSTVVVRATGVTGRSASTSYDISSEVVFSSSGSGSSSPAAKFAYDDTVMRPSQEIEIEEEEEAVYYSDAGAADAVSLLRSQERDGDGDGGEETPTLLPAEENVPVPGSLGRVTFAFEPQVEEEPNKESEVPVASYRPVSDDSATDLLTFKFRQVPLQSDTGTDGNDLSIFATVPSDFLCPLTRQMFSNPVTIETGQTFERHAIIQWLDRGFRMCPVTGQELSSLTVPDTNRVLKRLVDSWKSEHCEHLISGSVAGFDVKLTVPVIDNALDSAEDMSEKLDKARHIMAIGGIDFLLHRFQEGGGDEQLKAAEHLLFCIRAEGSCRNYVAVKIDGSSVLRLLHSEVHSARRSAVGLLTELLCLRRREMFELLLQGLRTVSIMEAMDVLLEYLRSLPVEEQAPIAVLLLRFDALVEPNRNSTYREEATKTITHSLRCCLTEDNAVPSTRRALLLLGGHFTFSGDLLAEDWMLKQAGFINHSSQATAASSDAVVHNKEEAAENDAWPRHVAAALLGSSIGIRRPFLDALSRCLGSPDAGLVSACLTTAGWLSRALASSLEEEDGGAAADTSLAAFSALLPRLKQCLAPSRPPQHRVLAAMSLHNFSRIPDCRELLVMLADGLRDHLADLAQLTWTAGQLSAELRAVTNDV